MVLKTQKTYSIILLYKTTYDFEGNKKKIPACIFVAAAIFDDAVFSHLKEEKIINTTF